MSHRSRLRKLSPIGDPIVHVMKERIENRAEALPPTIDLTQALIAAPPPLEAQDLDLHDPALHRLGAVPGDGVLRERIAAYRSSAFDTALSAENVIVTAGANQAFALAVAGLIPHRRRVLLLSPYFFNHAMTLRLCGARPVEFPVEPQSFQPNGTRLAKAVDSDTVALVVTDPSNPTGMVLTPESRSKLYEVVQASRTWLLLDETYVEFEYQPKPPAPELPLEQSVVIGSFSKSLSLSGWRVGYLIAHASVVEQLLKVQDALIIAAPTAAQRLALCAMERREDHLRDLRPRLRTLRDDLIHALQASSLFDDVRGEAGVFVWAKLAGRSSSALVSDELLDRCGVAALPGSSFGGEGWMRFAYGSLQRSQVGEIKQRLQDAE